MDNKIIYIILLSLLIILFFNIINNNIIEKFNNNKKKYIAVLISGEIRTFVLKEQILFFNRLMNYLHKFFDYVHVYIILKIPDENNSGLIKSKQGLENLDELNAILKPNYIYYFHDFNYKNKYNGYNSQIKLIDMCIEKALEFEKLNNIKYNMFLRIRPDSCFIIEELNIEDKIDNKIYTSIKSDSIGSDQVFLFNQYILYEWWIFHVRKLIMIPMEKTPEYIIFNNHKDIVKQSFQNWLVRDYDTVVTWDTNSSIKKSLNTEYIWNYKENYNKLLIKISHKDFFNNITKIANNNIGTYIDFN